MLGCFDVIDLDDLLCVGTSHYNRQVHCQGTSLNLGGIYYLLRLLATDALHRNNGAVIIARNYRTANPDDVRCLRDPLLALQYIMVCDKFGIIGIPIVLCESEEEISKKMYYYTVVGKKISTVVRVHTSREGIKTELDPLAACVQHNTMRVQYNVMNTVPNAAILQETQVLYDILRGAGVEKKYSNVEGKAENVDLLVEYKEMLTKNTELTPVNFLVEMAKCGKLETSEAMTMLQYFTQKETHISDMVAQFDVSTVSRLQRDSVALLGSLFKFKDIRTIFDKDPDIEPISQNIKPSQSYTNYLCTMFRKYADNTLFEEFNISNDTAYYTQDKQWDNDTVDKILQDTSAGKRIELDPIQAQDKQTSLFSDSADMDLEYYT